MYAINFTIISYHTDTLIVTMGYISCQRLRFGQPAYIEYIYTSDDSDIIVLNEKSFATLCSR